MFSGSAHRLHAFWKERVHPAASREQVAIAFSLLAGGLALGILGILTAITGDLLFPRSSIFDAPSWMRELGIALAAVGLPAFLLGLVVALPARMWLRATASTGAVVAVVGVGLFVWLYPEQWARSVSGPNAWAIGTYVAGVSLLSAGAAASVANYFVQRASALKGSADPTRREVTDEEIAADLAWADQQGWSWGGVRQGAPKTRIILKESMEPVQFLGRGKRVHLVGADSSETEIEAARTLTQLRGIKKPQHASMVHDQVGHLKALRERKAAEAAARRPWWKRVLGLGG